MEFNGFKGVLKNIFNEKWLVNMLYEFYHNVSYIAVEFGYYLMGRMKDCEKVGIYSINNSLSKKNWLKLVEFLRGDILQLPIIDITKNFRETRRLSCGIIVSMYTASLILNKDSKSRIIKDLDQLNMLNFVEIDAKEYEAGFVIPTGMLS